jgi:dTDP-glucose 4,6-dehydratase
VVRRALVTGGAGFIGAAVVRRLLADPDVERVVTLDALTYAGSLSRLDGVDGRHRFVHGDINDRALVEGLLRDEGLETVLHLAAESHVDRSIAGPDPFVRTNVVGTSELLEACRRVWLEEGAVEGARFHHVSTDEVFGDLPPDAPPATEDAPYRPSSPYAASKAAADHLVRAWHRTYGLPVSLSHGSNTYGPLQVPEKLLPVVVRAAVRGAPIPVYGDGQQERDWLHVDDHADAIVHIAAHGAVGRSYNVAGGTSLRNLELVGRVCALVDALRPASAPHAALVRRVTDRLGHDRRYALDGSRLRDELGWRPRVGFEDGLAATVAHIAKEAS